MKRTHFLQDIHYDVESKEQIIKLVEKRLKKYKFIKNLYLVQYIRISEFEEKVYIDHVNLDLTLYEDRLILNSYFKKFREGYDGGECFISFAVYTRPPWDENARYIKTYSIKTFDSFINQGDGV